MDSLQQKATEIIKQADAKNKQTIQSQSKEVSDEWEKLVADLQRRRDALNALAAAWEVFEGRWQHFESVLVGVEEKSKHVDTIVRNRQQVIATQHVIEVGQEQNLKKNELF